MANPTNASFPDALSAREALMFAAGRRAAMIICSLGKHNPQILQLLDDVEEQARLAAMIAWDRGKYDPTKEKACPEAYGSGIGRKVALKAIAKAGQALKRSAGPPPDHLPDRKAQDQERKRDLEETILIMLEGMKQLDDEDREILCLSYFEGQTTQQMVETLGIPTSTFYMRRYRARFRLKAILARLGITDV